ncbi:type VII secretion target [Nocardioides sp. Leaf285]|uniref:type VII secretion target n=1 Tax=Nocardioides sp. Leaf285 TaxID=1736322 RepID=UPI00070382AA|nr:type VII secretion target [Nocardioides sp. Leaf285]KQP64091.1 hypothetical protein ASF47_08580 [Nocardioides sp. Leaf285]
MSIDVTLGEMRAHASHLDVIAETATEGVDAGRAVSIHGDAFGLLCAFIGEALEPVQSVGVDSAKAAVAGVSGTADAVRGLADIFGWTDDVVNDLFNVFKGQ